jgi:hypothetical protein
MPRVIAMKVISTMASSMAKESLFGVMEVFMRSVPLPLFFQQTSGGVFEVRNQQSNWCFLSNPGQ